MMRAPTFKKKKRTGKNGNKQYFYYRAIYKVVRKKSP